MVIPCINCLFNHLQLTFNRLYWLYHVSNLFLQWELSKNPIYSTSQVYICIIYIYIYLFIYLFIYIHIYIYTYIRIHIYIYTYNHIYIQLYTHTCIYIPFNNPMYIYNPHMFIYFPHPRRPVRRWSSDKLKAGSACCTNVRTLVGTNNGVLMVVHGLFTVLS